MYKFTCAPYRSVQQEPPDEEDEEEEEEEEHYHLHPLSSNDQFVMSDEANDSSVEKIDEREAMQVPTTAPLSRTARSSFDSIADDAMIQLDLSHLRKLRRHLRIAVIHGSGKQVHVAKHVMTSLQAMGFRHVYMLAKNATLCSKLVENKIQMGWLQTGGPSDALFPHALAMLEMLGKTVSVSSNTHICKKQKRQRV